MDIESRSKKMGRMLQKRYIIALSIIAFLVIFSQIIIQYTIAKQQDDSRVVNISGRQRMLSQRINKAAFGLYISSAAKDQERYLEELGYSLDLWEKSHNGLRNGDPELGLPDNNSQKIIEMFESIDKEYNQIVEAARSVHQIGSVPNYDKDALLKKIHIIQSNEEAFLKGMDAIVFQYDAESKQKIAFIRLTEIVILFVTFFTLLMEILFIFRPAQKQIEKSLQEIESHRDQLKEAEEVLKKYATIDEMTGLLNKRSGMLVLGNIFDLAKEADEDFCVCFADIDGLKDVNDVYGHEEGDFYIKTVSQVIRNNLKVSDSVFRYGGDEIVIILLHCDLNKAEQNLGNIQESMEMLSSELAKPYHLHFSYGIAAFRESLAETPEELLTLADKEMYKDKQKNRLKKK